MTSLSTSDTVSPSAAPDANLLNRLRLVPGAVLLVLGAVQLVLLARNPATAQVVSLSESSWLSSLLNVTLGFFLIASGDVLIGLVVAGLLLTYTVHGVYAGTQGKASCGCVPQVQLSPWISVAVAVALLTCLLFAWPAGDAGREAHGA